MMTNEDRIAYGREGIAVGNPDHNSNELFDSAGDTITNILHAVAADAAATTTVGEALAMGDTNLDDATITVQSSAADAVMARARMHFEAEIRGEV